jgi:hypothetical protein
MMPKLPEALCIVFEQRMDAAGVGPRGASHLTEMAGLLPGFL